MRRIAGERTLEAARTLVASALAQPNIYPQIRSDLMAIRNRLAHADQIAELDEAQSELLDAYIGLARRGTQLAPSDDAALVELARQLA
ncbi:hypothetical protein FP2506_10661 [Fulvimarina pelagi HTCC2506]|uniref:Uncharacterized protein n=1 Tax=Fulvimarina pelagi HTCC2506 TaxID=314231 RepID=Q0G4W4_9HYPH|nr:hypothetical protein [Fulvimarina pelagi]EAU43300.1 hypothetical protein FP2506_10661 [Fulvimarina pelagi HTCC2506]